MWNDVFLTHLDFLAISTACFFICSIILFNKYQKYVSCLVIDTWYGQIQTYLRTWSVQKVSGILNFCELRIFDFWFFWGVMLVLISLTYADKFSRFECSVNFWQLFCLDVFCSSSIFAYSKKSIEELASKFQGRTVNKEYYPQVMHNLCEAIH